MSWPVGFEGAAEPPPQAKFDKRDTWPVEFKGVAELRPKVEFDKFDKHDKGDRSRVRLQARGVAPGVLTLSWPVWFEVCRTAPQSRISNSTNTIKATKETGFAWACKGGG